MKTMQFLIVLIAGLEIGGITVLLDQKYNSVADDTLLSPCGDPTHRYSDDITFDELEPTDNMVWSEAFPQDSDRTDIYPVLQMPNWFYSDRSEVWYIMDEDTVKFYFTN